MILFRRRLMDLEEENEHLRYLNMDKIEIIQELNRQIETKDEIIHSLQAKQKQLERRIQRMLFELRVSDEVLTIATEKMKHEE